MENRIGDERGLTFQDHAHLHLLAVFHYVVGGIGAFFSLLFLLNVAVGVALMTGTMGTGPPEELAWFYVAAGLVFFVLGESLSACALFSARFINSRRHYRFSFVVACLMLFAVPLGTALGVFTIIVLSRPTVKSAYYGSPLDQGPQGVS